MDQDVGLSLIVIAKNEVRMLPELIEAHRGLADEFLVVDTGSTDGSQALAQSLGVRVVDRPWPGSFAEARNHAVELASHPWVLMLDADERLDPRWHSAVQQVTQGTTPVVYQLIQRTYTDAAQVMNWQPARGCAEARGRTGYFDESLGRLFPRHPQLRFEGVVHELIEPSAHRAGFEVRSTPWIVHHYREAQSRDKQQEKNQLYLALSREKVTLQPHSERARIELSAIASVCGLHDEAVSVVQDWVLKNPSSPEAAEQLGIALIEAGRMSSVADALHRSASLSTGSARARLYSLIGEAEAQLGFFQEALLAFECAEQIAPDSFRIQVNRGVAYLGLEQLGQAQWHFEAAAKLNPKSGLPLLNLALVAKRQGQLRQADALLREAALLEPERWEIHAHLAGISFDLEQFEDALFHAQRARSIEPHGPDAEIRACAAALALERPEEALMYAEQAAEKDHRYQSLAQDLRG